MRTNSIGIDGEREHEWRAWRRVAAAWLPRHWICLEHPDSGRVLTRTVFGGARLWQVEGRGLRVLASMRLRLPAMFLRGGTLVRRGSGRAIELRVSAGTRAIIDGLGRLSALAPAGEGFAALEGSFLTARGSDGSLTGARRADHEPFWRPVASLDTDCILLRSPGARYSLWWTKRDRLVELPGLDGALDARIARNSDRAVSLHEHGTARILDLASGATVCDVQGAVTMALDDSGTRLALSRDVGVVEVRSLDRGAVECDVRTSAPAVSVDFHPHDPVIVAGLSGGAIQLWSWSTSTLAPTWVEEETRGARYLQVAFADRGRRIWAATARWRGFWHRHQPLEGDVA